jgi:hypothetical protein
MFFQQSSLLSITTRTILRNRAETLAEVTLLSCNFQLKKQTVLLHSIPRYTAVCFATVASSLFYYYSL